MFFFRFNDISITVRTLCVSSAQNFVMFHPELVKDVVGKCQKKFEYVIEKSFKLRVFVNDKNTR